MSQFNDIYVYVILSIYTHYIYTYMCVYIYVSMYIYTHMCMNICMYIHAYIICFLFVCFYNFLFSVFEMCICITSLWCRATYWAAALTSCLLLMNGPISRSPAVPVRAFNNILEISMISLGK